MVSGRGAGDKIGECRSGNATRQDAKERQDAKKSRKDKALGFFLFSFLLFLAYLAFLGVLAL
jgi:hypothetical protein